MPKGTLIVVTGPSGVGKRTLIKHALDTVPGLWFSVSMTTRKPRPGEVGGKDYFFVDTDAFKQMIANDEFLEHAEFAGENFYGTPRVPVMKRLSVGVSVLAELEVQGARQVKEKMPESKSIFIEPPYPTITTLRQRILARGDVPPESMERRLRTALDEIGQAHYFDFRLVNDHLEQAKQVFLEHLNVIMATSVDA